MIHVATILAGIIVAAALAAAANDAAVNAWNRRNRK